MKFIIKIIAIVVCGVASVLLAQFLVKKFYHKWSGGEYISLYDEDENNMYIPQHSHMSSVYKRFWN